MKTVKEFLKESKISKAGYDFAKEVLGMNGIHPNKFTSAGIDEKKMIISIDTDDGMFEFSFKVKKSK